MSGFIGKMSRLGCSNLLAFAFIATLCIATTPKPTSVTHRGSPEPELDLGEQQEISKISANNLSSSTKITPDLLVAASAISKTHPSSKIEDQEASPSVTSVHQVWTSSSSGSLEELSPEVISKLHQDVPFLAAYALRPRLVGATGNSQQSASSLTGQSNNLVSESGSPVSSSSERSLLTAASSPQVSQTAVLGPRLGDISEYKVETSSSSKSEHHHKRKTTLKKKTDDEIEAKRRQVLTASQLVKKRSSRVKTKPLRAPKSSRRRSGKRGSRARSVRRSRKGKKRSRASRLRQKQRSRGVGARARYQNGSTDQTSNEIDGDTSNGNRMEVESRSAGDQTTMLVDGSGGVKGGDVRGTKGGSSIDRSKQRPFYARSKPGDNPEEVGEDQPASSGEGESNRNTTDGGEATDNNSPVDDNADNDDGVEAGVSEPRRVGDDDVEEDGDTVTVMPKSDGVDDDPDIGDAPPNEEEAELGPKERERENSDSPPDNDLGEEPRTRRINRERPNPSLKPDVDQPEDERANGDGTAAGGGIGATTGGASTGVDAGQDGTASSADERNSEKEADSDDIPNVTESTIDTDDGSIDSDGKSIDEDDRDRTGTANASSGSNGKGRSGDRSGERRTSGGSDDSEAGTDDAAQKGAEEFEPERSGSRAGDTDNRTGRPETTSGDGTSSPRKGGAAASDEDDSDGGDLDYRDELAEAERKRQKGERKTEVGKEDATSHSGRGKGGSDKKECDDGSYDHHSDHHGDHHDHHNSIEWLRGAIPGEPGVDYPTLSGINKSDFNCNEQKYPGYYADVDSRCQIFHICQADGRQDSFICPNGTIFSQITTVCVWWNSFNCEDAPKYYALNALLYKTPASSYNKNSLSTSDLRPRDGARLEPKTGGVERAGGSSSEESPIDDLISAMRRSKEAAMVEDKQTGVTYDSSKKAGTMGGSGSFGTDDEATIQRKSTNLDDDSELMSSRLRSKAVPRRRRRASVKQAPPKLKSRRVSRNSRRRKLRHGIKPKRRA